MARTIDEINQGIVDATAADATLGTLLTSTSKVAMWRLKAWIVSVCMYVLETLFDLHKAEVQGIITAQKAHTLGWYETMMKAFQYGFQLVDEKDYYDNTNVDPATLAASLIITQASAKENQDGSVRIKLAKTVAGVLGPLSGPELTAATSYASRIKDAGVRLIMTSQNADALKLILEIYYDAQILDNTGKRLDGTNDTPIQNAIVSYLQSQNIVRFNGLFVLSKLVDVINAVDGVVYAQVDNAQAREYGVVPWTQINVLGAPNEYTPAAGYMNIDVNNDLTMNFTPHPQI